MRWCTRCERQHWFADACESMSKADALVADVYIALNVALAQEWGRLFREARERREQDERR